MCRVIAHEYTLKAHARVCVHERQGKRGGGATEQERERERKGGGESLSLFLSLSLSVVPALLAHRLQAHAPRGQNQKMDLEHADNRQRARSVCRTRGENGHRRHA